MKCKIEFLQEYIADIIRGENCTKTYYIASSISMFTFCHLIKETISPWKILFASVYVKDF